jgi:hypothetical protein
MKDGIHPEGYAVTRKKTNADRIRNMTDEELAEIFAQYNISLDKDGWLEWLRAESEG